MRHAGWARFRDLLREHQERALNELVGVDVMTVTPPQVAQLQAQAKVFKLASELATKRVAQLRSMIEDYERNHSQEEPHALV